MSLFDRLVDRIHAPGDAALTARGLSVERLPGGRRRVSHPDLPALLEARRRHVLRHGLDPADRAALDVDTLAALCRTHARTTAADRLPGRTAA